MKKIFIPILLALVLIISALPLTSCTYVPSVPETTVTRIIIDAEAEVELIVNFKNNVATVTPLNEIAEILLSGETLINMTPDKTAAEIAKLIGKSGLLYTDKTETVRLSISGDPDSDYVEVITKMIEKKLTKTFKKYDVTIKIEHFEPATDDELKALLMDEKLYSEKMIDEYVRTEKNFALALARIESAALPTSVFKYMYFSNLERAGIIFQKDQIAVMIKELGDAHAETLAAYENAIAEMKKASDAIDSFIYDSYLSADCDYITNLEALYDMILFRSADAYDMAKEMLDITDENIKNELSAYYTAFEEANAAVIEIENNFDQEIVVKYRNVGIDIQNKVSEYEDGAKDRFNEKYASELSAARDALNNVKTQLIGK